MWACRERSFQKCTAASYTKVRPIRLDLGSLIYFLGALLEHTASFPPRALALNNENPSLHRFIESRLFHLSQQCRTPCIKPEASTQYVSKGPRSNQLPQEFKKIPDMPQVSMFLSELAYPALLCQFYGGSRRPKSTFLNWLFSVAISFDSLGCQDFVSYTMHTAFFAVKKG